jgi:hypothetical protein
MDRKRQIDHLQESEDMALLIRKFAAAEHFRSATVAELELNSDFCRRPLRPEDLEFIDFVTPVSADTICDLPTLAAQRILRCIYDLQISKLPPSGDRETLQRHADFHAETSRIVAAQITPFLERFAFGFLAPPQSGGALTSAEVCERFESLLQEITGSARNLCSLFERGDFSKNDLRFIFVQRWCLDEAKHAAVGRAQASGYFDLLPASCWPRNGSDCQENEALANLATTIDVNREPNTFWQFYLPTSLAEANYLSALAGRPELSFAFVGASLVAEIEWQSFAWMALQIGQHMALIGPRNAPREEELDIASAETANRFSQAVSSIEKAFGTAGLEELLRGVEAAGGLAQFAQVDLEKQLRWLASIEDYVEIARRLDDRIHTSGVKIDRETFVEPRAMCSTTHVHNDHRLVVVQDGKMVFWGRPAMRFRMVPGDMILVPRGRLHGSSVESEQCTYHQPIIPEAWVGPLIGEIDRRHRWPAAQPLSSAANRVGK